MVFSAEYRILIKELPESGIWGKLQDGVYRNWIRDVDQLKSRLIEEWEQFQQSVINEAVKQ